ncbi:AAR2 domain containing protein [Metarhizium album ARSEF 1941]|uniref:AAR2 domain containing protein n=1 Tax=Metarhizium album (strain ARSEF 1941) TaxID=1081103 RepID=A0A0B2WY12_METAS|nr:AAR2 domain containing protein [Metarhizium album ARSEF 1941]KHO01172.1 AAR2 domain containing protein [Metarhizium album ARSEF 1941]
MDAKGASASTTPRGIRKSNSTKSAGAHSTKSHESVDVLGVHPFGTLRVLRPEWSPRISEQMITAGSHEEASSPLPPPPPLDFPAESAYGLVGNHLPSRDTSSASPTKRCADPQAHQMGGGDVAVILDLPEVFLVAYDSVSFTAHNFAGVRDIPPGPHFFWVAHPSGVAARAGVWLLGSESQDHVHVVQWDSYNEVLTEATRSESRNSAENMPNIHAQLIPYPDPSRLAQGPGRLSVSQMESNRSIWAQLTTHVNATILNRITGPQVGGWIVHTLDRAQGALQFSPEVELERAVPNKNLQRRELNFTFETTTRLFSIESLGAERTQEAMDPSVYLMSQIEDPDKNLAYEDLVGEFQFSFIVGVHLGNDASLEQWWFMLLKLLVKSHLLLQEQPLLVASMWRTVAAQITYSSQWMESSVLDNTESRCRELRIGLIVYKRRMEEFLSDDENVVTSDHLSVSTAFSRLEAVLTDLGWDLSGDYLRKGVVMMEDGEQVELELTDLEAEDERGEWAPELVELDEDGRERGLISWSS